MYHKSGIRQGSRDLEHEMKSRRGKKVRPGVLVIKWSPGVAGAKGGRTLAAAGSTAPTRQVDDRLRYLKNNHGLTDVVPVFGQRGKSVQGSKGNRWTNAVRQSFKDADDDKAAGLTILRVSPKTDLKAVARHLRGSGVEYVETSPMRWLAGKTTLDPRLSAQWGLQAIDWHNANRPSASRIAVAVIDSGVDQEHPDLKKAIDEYDYGSLGATDRVGHGTHVAGIIAAVANNRVGIAGVSNARLHCWKVFDAHDDYDDVAYLRALGAVAAKKSIKVLNLSLGGDDSSKAEEDLLDRLARRGVLVVAAMGNEYEEGNPTEYPAAYDGVMAIGAVGPAHRRSVFSNVGKHISIVAPGENILSTLPRRPAGDRKETEYAAWDGTSFATPFVAGAAALVFARYPNYSPAQVRRRLETTVTKPKAMRAKHSSAYGYGELNLNKALARKPAKSRKKR